MKLFLSEGNPHGVKVLAAAGIWAAQVEIQRLQQEEKVVPFLSQPKLPALELDNGSFLFTPNAICRCFYLSAGKETSDLINQWLEWEATELQPSVSAALYAHVVQGRKKEDVLQTVNNSLVYIAQNITKKAYLAGVSV
ncbi:hypothetical protein AB205_0158060 [Aquarana catesbeiana]|uniref:Methionine--tRNA ligase N-terminal domain-containing protein n=1 Tax=Aquarana catesbeiana TaxID=8400 RepID=A0A2G9S2H9_AQUCT|nr:hypothetical protein AB205_0158060 [Aquarana catesbeiana]